MTDTQTPEQIEQASDAAFHAGFAASRGEPTPPAPAAVVEKPPVQETQPTPDPTPVEEVPPWQAPLDELTKQLRVINGHIGNLSSQTKELRSALAEAKTVTQAKGAETPSEQEVAFAVKNPERMKRLKEDFPEWGEAFEEELGAVLAAARSAIPKPFDPAALQSEITAAMEARLAQAEKDRATHDEEVTAKARVLARVDIAHDEWETTINTPDFGAWFEKQKPDIQKLSASPKAADAIHLLDLYEDHRKKVAEKAERDKRLDAARQPEGVQVPATPSADPQAAFERGFANVRGS